MGRLFWIHLFCRHLCDVFGSMSTSPSFSSLGTKKTIKKPTIKSRNHRRLHWLAPVSRLDHRFWRLARLALVMLPVLQWVSCRFLYTNQQHLGDKVSNELVTRKETAWSRVQNISFSDTYEKWPFSVGKKVWFSERLLYKKRMLIYQMIGSCLKVGAFPAKSSKFSIGNLSRLVRQQSWPTKKHWDR